ncbi:hypothetical protein [Tropicibacter sp. R16_0]|uniref:hypothetical protein n=1 Tax=Tropicibacter sp. R16_0 TaxID=2821102 RepID=UPI001ADB2F1C|nr:hypothetical protein [Tropicibacter sp. R16_0]
MGADKSTEKSLKETLSLEALQERMDVMGRAIFGDSKYGKLMHGALSAQTTMQQTFSEQMAKGLSFYNMPSQDDLSSIADQCNRIEERLMHLEQMLQTLVDKSDGVSSPSTARVPRTRTRKPKPVETPEAKTTTSKSSPKKSSS